MYTRLPPALLPLGSRSAPAAARGRNRLAVGAAAGVRLTEFVRGVLGARGERAATLAIESKLRRKVVNLDTSSSAQTEAQSAGLRAARSGSSGRAKHGLSGKQSKNVVSRVTQGAFICRTRITCHSVRKCRNRLCVEAADDPKRPRTPGFPVTPSSGYCIGTETAAPISTRCVFTFGWFVP